MNPIYYNLNSSSSNSNNNTYNLNINNENLLDCNSLSSNYSSSNLNLPSNDLNVNIEILDSNMLSPKVISKKAKFFYKNQKNVKKIALLIQDISKIKLILNNDLIRTSFDGECPLCYEKKTEIGVVDCCTNHICLDCLKNYTESFKDNKDNIKCPLCRQKILNCAICLTEKIKKIKNIELIDLNIFKNMFYNELLNFDFNIKKDLLINKTNTLKIICNQQIINNIYFTNIKFEKNNTDDDFESTLVEILLLDISSSMYNESTNIYNYINKFLEYHKNQNSKVALIVFNDKSKLIFQLTKINNININHIKKLCNFNISGCTYMNDSIIKATELFNNYKLNDNNDNNIYKLTIITDGQMYDYEDTLINIDKIHEMNINLNVIGTGNEYSWSHCSKIVKNDPTKYQYINNISNIVFDTDLNNLINIYIEGDIIDSTGNISFQNILSTIYDDNLIISNNELKILIVNNNNNININSVNNMKNLTYYYFFISIIQSFNHLNSLKDSGQYSYLQILEYFNKLKKYILDGNKIFIYIDLLKFDETKLEDIIFDEFKLYIFSSIQNILIKLNEIIDRVHLPFKSEFVPYKENLNKYNSTQLESNNDASFISSIINDSKRKKK